MEGVRGAYEKKKYEGGTLIEEKRGLAVNMPQAAPCLKVERKGGKDRRRRRKRSRSHQKKRATKPFYLDAGKGR